MDKSTICNEPNFDKPIEPGKNIIKPIQDINKTIANVFKFLDTIELKDYLAKYKNTNKTIQDLMDELSEEYPYKDIEVNGLFDAIAEDEFIDYLKDRYSIRIYESVIVNNYIR